jgi:hypothetical protein
VSLEQFQTALIIMRAIERCIEIIGEAARRVSKTTQQLIHPTPGVNSSRYEAPAFEDWWLLLHDRGAWGIITDTTFAGGF